MRLVRKLAIIPQNKEEKGIDFTRHLSGDERVALLEDIRQEMSKVIHYEYPSRLRRILKIIKR